MYAVLLLCKNTTTDRGKHRAQSDKTRQGGSKTGNTEHGGETVEAKRETRDKNKHCDVET